MNKINRSGYSALSYSLINGYPEEFVKSLFNQKTNLNQKTYYGNSPLFIALKLCYSNDMIKLLINKEIIINQKNKYRENLFDFLFKKFSRKRILEILDIFRVVFYIKEYLVNFMKLNVHELWSLKIKMRMDGIY